MVLNTTSLPPNLPSRQMRRIRRLLLLMALPVAGWAAVYALFGHRAAHGLITVAALAGAIGCAGHVLRGSGNRRGSLAAGAFLFTLVLEGLST